MQDMYQFARRVAGKMSRDPEVMSYAMTACKRALERYDESKGVPLKRWVARCVKIDVWCYWRRLRKHYGEQQSEVFWEAVYVEVPYEDTQVRQKDYQLLYEHYVERWPLDVIARRHGFGSKKNTKKELRAALLRFVLTTEHL